MSAFIGQEALFKTINEYTWQTMPHTLLFLGEEGCGKKTIAKYLANKLGFRFIEINSNATTEELLDYQYAVLKTIYMIDLSNFRLERDQNKFLKFIEEPSANVYTILVSESEIGIMPTILNRCTKFRFEQYTIEQLKQIVLFNNELVYKVCKTPGQLNNINEAKAIELYNYCNKLIDILPRAEYANIISIAAKINYKEDYNKFDFSIFFRMLEYVAVDRYIKERNIIAYKVYTYTVSKLDALIQNRGIQKEPFMINFLDGLWKEVK